MLGKTLFVGVLLPLILNLCLSINSQAAQVTFETVSLECEIFSRALDKINLKSGLPPVELKGCIENKEKSKKYFWGWVTKIYRDVTLTFGQKTLCFSKEKIIRELPFEDMIYLDYSEDNVLGYISYYLGVRFVVSGTGGIYKSEVDRCLLE